MTHSKTVSDVGEVKVVGFKVRWSMGMCGGGGCCKKRLDWWEGRGRVEWRRCNNVV